MKEKSRNIVHGSVVRLRGNKFILCGGGRYKPFGVYNCSSVIKVYTLDDKLIKIEIPEGIRVFGEATCRISSR